MRWLFPIHETIPAIQGEEADKSNAESLQNVSPMIYLSTPLTPLSFFQSEIELMRKDINIAHRFLRSYILILHFYGLKLLDPSTGELNRNEITWRCRYGNLQRSPALHNARISTLSPPRQGE